MNTQRKKKQRTRKIYIKWWRKKEILDKIEKENPNFKKILETINDTTTVLEIANLQITDEQLIIARPLIKTCTNLIEINLENNYLENIEYIQELPNVRRVNLQGNKIQSLENSEIFFGCTSLEYLDLSYNNIIEFNEIFLTNIRETLKTLKINNNKELEEELEDDDENKKIEAKKLSSMQWLKNFKSLEILEAKNNEITESRFFANLPNLEELYLSGNSIISLNDMKGLPNLTIIDISDNKFWNLKLVQSWGKNISKSLITNKWSSISNLKSFSSLETVIIDDEIMKNTEYLKYIDWGTRLWIEDQKWRETNGEKWTEIVREKINQERIRF